MALLSKDETEIKDETVKKEEENKDDIEKKVEKNEKIDILYSEEDLTDLFNMNISKLSLKK
ncbi:MAG: hypothetical protein PF569_04655 [Candidatus Woesearchaeota archaeon]|jgi:hypothetical protein|nr:hypothetical protein [Candidatus Woesearchaeota archaeon]